MFLDKLFNLFHSLPNQSANTFPSTNEPFQSQSFITKKNGDLITRVWTLVKNNLKYKLSVNDTQVIAKSTINGKKNKISFCSDSTNGKKIRDILDRIWPSPLPLPLPLFDNKECGQDLFKKTNSFFNKELTSNDAAFNESQKDREDLIDLLDTILLSNPKNA